MSQERTIPVRFAFRFIPEVVNIGKRLEVVTLDLAGTPDEVLAQVRDVAQIIRTLRAATAHPDPAVAAIAPQPGAVR